MTNQINFQQAEIDELMALLEAVKDVPDTTPGKYRDLYAFVHSIIETSSLVDGRTKLFFRLATIINNDEPASANLYIRTVTSLGLQHDGLLPSDPIEAENLIQRTSNIIGEAIFAHLVDVQGIPSLASIIQSDVTISIQDGGQTWGGWGGALFFLSERVGPESESLAKLIFSDPQETNKFQTVVAAAANLVMEEYGITDEFGSALWQYVKSAYSSIFGASGLTVA